MLAHVRVTRASSPSPIQNRGAAALDLRRSPSMTAALMARHAARPRRSRRALGGRAPRRTQCALRACDARRRDRRLRERHLRRDGHRTGAQGRDRRFGVPLRGTPSTSRRAPPWTRCSWCSRQMPSASHWSRRTRPSQRVRSRDDGARHADARTARRGIAHALRHRFAARAGLGLNPHAGEDGLLGREEIEVIRPVCDAFRQGSMWSVRCCADTLFTPDRVAGADAVLAMYHDQGLPVLKYAGFGRAVNVTFGLPIIRTSVDHGTALDIAGRGIAEVGSLEMIELRSGRREFGTAQARLSSAATASPAIGRASASGRTSWSTRASSAASSTPSHHSSTRSSRSVRVGAPSRACSSTRCDSR